MFNLCLKSLLNRRFIATLTVLSIALSVALIVGVERLRTEARAGFSNSASGIDLIIAARGNDVQILMATVFGVGTTGAGITWESYEMIEDLPQVSWTVPIMMGDNHRGYPVIGTSKHYFDRFRHSGGRHLTFSEGHSFSSADGAVIGAEVARVFEYGLGTAIVNAHGSGEVAFDVHDEAPFTVTGVLGHTGTAVDRMVFVSLEGFDALHEEPTSEGADPFVLVDAPEVAEEHEDHDTEHSHNEDHAASEFANRHADHGEEHEDHSHVELDEPDEHEEGHQEYDDSHAHESDHEDEAEAVRTSGGHDHGGHDHEPEAINAIFAGLEEKTAVLSVQRQLADHRDEALTAVLPNVALLQLWSITSTAETALRLMAGAVAVAGMIGMVVMLSASLDNRRREFAILRSVGATPAGVFSLILLEAVLLLSAGIVLGVIALSALTLVIDPILAANFGLRIGVDLPSFREVLLIALVFCSGLLASIVPALRVYRMTLSDGLSVRL
ncbi:ABC transporter permease [Ruegeria sp. AD91A]|uniref:FtsX-like permease family protein n=1 Tax=Ruegeria sp. AD91A TaxID=2293862 RepID=UPI000E47E977|nr:FtsX-like permease family protein [Ruegeria sp. AD91A]AXT27412.1 ABC transporter permease [Ruegeria sp. AD91A]